MAARLKLSAWIVLTVAEMSWLISCVARGEDGEPRLLYFPVAEELAIIPQEIRITAPKIRDVVLLVPNFPCGACQWWESQVLSKIQGIRVIKRVDMDQPSWPRLVLPDRAVRNTWNYEHPQTRQPLSVKDIELIIKAFPPDAVESPRAAGSDPK